MRRERLVVATVVLCGVAMYVAPVAVVLGPTLQGGVESGTSTAQASPGPTDSRLAFTEVGAETGLEYESTRVLEGTQGTMGRAGVFVSDYDNDAQTDLLMLGGERPVLFENTGGEYGESSALPELDGNATFRTALFVDYDNDGYDDLVLLPMGDSPVLLHNDGGEFSVRPDAFDTSIDVPVTATAADYDDDGCVDLFVTQNGDWIDTYPARVQPNRTDDNGKPNYLFQGSCGPAFTAVEDVGIDGEHWSLSASFTDFTGDGRPDVHVANDFYYDVLYVNEGDGTFTAREIPETNRNGMASEVADVNGDGSMDVFVSNIFWTDEIRSKLDSLGMITTGSIGNNLLLNDGTGNFSDEAAEWGVRNGRWGWAAVMTDLDNDGDRDLFHTTRKQFVPEEVQDRWGDEFERYGESRIFERVGPEQFHARSASDVGFDRTDGRGVGQVDFDNDGDADVVVADIGGPARLYRNDVENGSAVQVVVHPIDNRTALGTQVTVITEAGIHHERVTSRSDFLSQDSRALHIGLGDVDRVKTLRIEYPDGTVATFRDRCVGQRLVVRGEEIVFSHSLTGANSTRSPTC